MDVSYEGIDEAELVFALHNGTRAQGMGILHERKGLTLDDVRADLEQYKESFEENERIRFDYYYGRPLKVTLDTKNKMLLRTDLYDRDAGDGMAQLIINRLRKEK